MMLINTITEIPVVINHHTLMPIINEVIKIQMVKQGEEINHINKVNNMVGHPIKM
jgi:hypothetical protein